jgi:hypothetical protein
MRLLSTWTTERAVGSTACDSAHYFTDNGKGTLAAAFYSQGTRFLDVRDPRHIRQVGFYRPDDADTWASYWRPGGYVFVADFTRGVDVLKVGALKNVVAAPASTRTDRPNTASPAFGWVCQVPVALNRP